MGKQLSESGSEQVDFDLTLESPQSESESLPRDLDLEKSQLG